MSRDTERGGSAVEFALLLPLLVLLLAAIVAFGIAFRAQQALQAAVSDAARQVMVEFDDEGADSPTAIANQAVSDAYGGNAAGVLVGVNDLCSAADDPQVTVDATQPVDVIVPGIPPLTVRAMATMPCV